MGDINGKNTRAFVKKMSRLGHKPARDGIWQGEQANKKGNSQEAFRIFSAIDGKAKTPLGIDYVDNIARHAFTETTAIQQKMKTKRI